MANSNSDANAPLQFGTALFQAQNVRLRPDTLLDEVRIEGADISVQPPASPGDTARVQTGEMKFRATMSEPNLNLLIQANFPADIPIRNLHIALFSGKARISGQLHKVISLPFTVEATLLITHGVRVGFDLTDVRAGIGMPAVLVEMLEQAMNRACELDLTKLPFPVYLDEARCEPGRLTVVGKARVIWPPVAAGQIVKPFSVRDPAPVLAPAAEKPALPSAPPPASNPFPEDFSAVP